MKYSNTHSTSKNKKKQSGKQSTKHQLHKQTSQKNNTAIHDEPNLIDQTVIKSKPISNKNSSTKIYGDSGSIISPEESPINNHKAKLINQDKIKNKNKKLEKSAQNYQSNGAK